MSRHLGAQLARNALSEDDLDPYQVAIRDDLTSGPDGECISQIHQWWEYNVGELVRRGTATSPAKPRITLKVFFTRRGDFVLEWEPTDNERENYDWLGRPGFADLTPVGRELVRIRCIQEAYRCFHEAGEPEIILPAGLDSPSLRRALKERQRLYGRWKKAVDATLLQSCAGLVDHLKTRLQYSFDLLVITDVFIDWTSCDDADGWPRKELARWKIERVADRTRRLELAELEELPRQLGCPIDVFAAALINSNRKKATGPAPSIGRRDERISAALKKAGHSKMMPAKVRRYRELIERHRSDLLPAAEGSPANGSSEVVVPFPGSRRPPGS